MSKYLTKCPGTSAPTVGVVIQGHTIAACAACNRKFPKLVAGTVAPRHYLGTQAHG